MNFQNAEAMQHCNSSHTRPLRCSDSGSVRWERVCKTHSPSKQAWAPGYFSNESGSKGSPQSCFSGCQTDWHCPVCLQTSSFPIRTNCGHLFCAPCLITYWKHGSWLGPISCPLCRQKVSVLHRLFKESRTDRQARDVLEGVSNYNRRFSGTPRQVTDYLYDTPLFLHLFLRGLGSLGGLVGLFLLRVMVCSFGAAVSLASSWEALLGPFCGVLGLLDDLVVVFLLLICVINVSQQAQPQGAAVAQTAARGVLADSL